MIPALATFNPSVYLPFLFFLRWIEGETGFPFIDCFMRELKVTGYCNHMGRETAGWFLIADLQLDWRMAAEWFESVLRLGGPQDPLIKLMEGHGNPIYKWPL